ncbi:MAG: hypothetical protein WCH30_05600 [Chlorobiaceae bacterium]
MKLSKASIIPALFGFLSLHSPDAGAAQTSVTTYMPNNHGKSITTPVAWGAYNNVVFLGAGGTVPSPYTTKNDGAAVLGVGLGDPVENIGVQASLISIDISEWKEYSSAFHLFRELGNADAIGVGVENVMLTSGGDADKSFYVVYSRGLQYESVLNKDIKTTKLHYSVGAGTGRFGDKSPQDIADGKGRHGTYIFGNLAYEVADSFNIVTDWNGLNLNAGVSKSFTISNVPFAVTAGLADLTRNSGDGVRFVFAGGFGFKL